MAESISGLWLRQLMVFRDYFPLIHNCGDQESSTIKTECQRLN
jgi:hypothetical protein